eukprot:6655391-Ditylum_brightwellii.AAC.1
MRNCFDKELWVSKDITAIWSIFRLVWNSRNAHLHTEMSSTYGSVLDLQISNTLCSQLTNFSSICRYKNVFLHLQHPKPCG